MGNGECGIGNSEFPTPNSAFPIASRLSTLNPKPSTLNQTMTANQKLARQLALSKCPSGWWVTSGDGQIDMGPYGSRREASAARDGARRFLRNEHRRGFVRSER